MGDRLKSGSARLKSLEMQGYKTFASKNNFGFSPTITAIVGPNGSGKSNITDAIRWVLGEQSFTLLRGKRTEDMIFAGSDSRPRASMASAVITFDNEDSWLPIDFSEVTIGRRAYRDGQNEYILNGQKVRLRDLNELLSKTGLAERTYTIIGQGLVDAALSLRADQRRQLFEEAAGIGLYRSRRDEALRRLETTRRNLERVQDILAELRPRLRSLKRQVDRSKDYDQVRDDLQELLRVWYGYHWYQLAGAVSEVSTLAEQQAERRQALREEQNETESQIRAARVKVDQLREQLRNWSHQASEIHQERERLGRQQAISEERQRWLQEQADQYRDEIAELEQAIAGFHDDLEMAQGQVDTSRADFERVQIAHAEIVNDGEVGTEERDRLRLDADRARGALEALAARVAVWESRQEQLEKDRAIYEAKLDEARGVLETIQAEAGSNEEAFKEKQTQLETFEAQHERVTKNLQSDEETITALRDEQANVEKRHNQLARRQGELTAQVEVFEATNSGSRKLLAEWNVDPVVGLIGRLEESLLIKRRYRPAILAALGDFRDGLAFEHFEQIMEALEHPSISSIETRAAFLAGDVGRSFEPLFVPDHPGCLGCAMDFVNTQGKAAEVLNNILGRTLVVRDHKAARELLSSLPDDGRIVTLHGDVFLPSGQVLVGSGPQAERELEQAERLISELGRTRDELAVVSEHFEGVQRSVEDLRERITTLRAERDQLQTRLGPARQEVHANRLSLATLQVELSQKQARVDELQGDLARIREEMNSMTKQGEDIDEQRRRLETEYKRSVEALEAIQLSDRMIEAEADLDRSQRELETAVANFEGLQARVAMLQRDLDLRRGRVKTNQAELEALVGEGEGLAEQLAEVEAGLSALEKEMAPAEDALAAAEGTRSELESGEVDLRMAIQAAEREHSRAQIDLARRQEELASMQRRIVDDFGLVAFDESEDLTAQEPLPFEGIVEHLTRVDEPPIEVEGQIKQLRMQLRRMGPVNPEARREYREVSQRVEFLTSQVDDLRKAEAQIHEVIAELDVLMEREFRVTYEAVATAFKESFTRLFGGGSARLELTMPDDLTQTGIDIEARLPGRRMQSLAMLSGGERSLTACALIFALLKVSPTPFCVLDEVDAMLDETNVTRFIEMLKELSKETQFILITHNRLTVQAAEVVYGISMGADTASKVISMNLEEASRQIAAD